MKPDSLEGLERVHPPPDFARLIAKGIALSAQLEELKIEAPANFAALISTRIHSAASSSPLAAFERVSPPPAFAALLAQRIAKDAVHLPALETLPAVRVPDGFASQLATRIEHDARALPILSALPRVAAPRGFAQVAIARIAADIGAEQGTNDRAPLYFIAALLGGVAVALLALTWPYASTAGAALLEILRVLPNTMLAPVIAVALLAMVGAGSSKVQWRLPAGLLAFAVAAVGVVPQSLPFFGHAQVSGISAGSVVRFAGDILVRGRVIGDVIAIGGNVRLADEARVNGRVLTFLGDVSLLQSSSVSSGVSAVLGTVNDASTLQPQRAQSTGLPGLSAASALRPLRALVTAGTWQWWYFALLVALASALILLPHLRHALQRPLRFQTGRSLSLGLLLLFITGPAVALGGLSLIGAPAALLLGVFTLLVFSSGAALALTELGALILQAFGITRPGLGRVVPGFAFFGAALLYPPLALALWLLFGAWGAGALLIALRDGELVASFNA